MIRIGLAAAAWAALSLPLHAEEKKPGPKAEETAKALKADAGGLILSIFAYGGPAPTAVSVGTEAALPKKARGPAVSITQDQMAAVIDALVAQGEFDKPQTPPPAGVLPPGWYLNLKAGGTAPKHFSWTLGKLDDDMASNATVKAIVKALGKDGPAVLKHLPPGKPEPPK